MLAGMSGGNNSIKLRLSLLVASTIIAIGALLCTVYLSWEWSGWQPACLVGLAGLFGAVVAARISERFTRPVMDLVEGAGEVSSGNLEHRVYVSGPREMKLLAAGFNDMAASLAEKIEGAESARLETESLNARLAQSYGEATRAAEKLREANDWMTEMALRMDHANTQLKAEINQTETIVHSIKDGLVALDKDETILLMNPVAEEIFDVRGDEVKGRNVQVLVDRLVEKVEEPEAFLRKFMATSSSPESESMFNITLAKPFRKVLRRRSSAIRDENGVVSGRVVVLSDITREKEVDSMKSNFVSIVSHELRTPLTSIKGALALLLDGQMEDPEARREFLSIADQNTDRLINLISGLLDLSKMESGMARLNVKRLDMAGLINSQIRSAELLARKREITIETRFPGGKQELFGDRDQLGQVITNLLGNAVKFSPDGGRVVVGTDVAEDEFTITVEDEGPGIPADKLEKVFEKFYQVDMSATRVMGGTGLGLAICRAIINEHAGKIRAESPVKPGGGGARIVVKLPKAGIVSRNVNPPSVHPVNPASYADSGDDVRDTVLLVDTDQEVLRVQSMQFVREGYRVITATTGSDALRLARDCRPGFIFMDTELPDIGGLDVAVMLRKDPDTKGIPIVFATSTGEAVTGQVSGLASGFIIKPYKVNELVATVRQYYM